MGLLSLSSIQHKVLPRTSWEVICFLLSSPSTPWEPVGAGGRPPLPPLPSSLLLPVQPMGWKGLITRLLNLNLSPLGTGVVNGSGGPGPSETNLCPPSAPPPALSLPAIVPSSPAAPNWFSLFPGYKCISGSCHGSLGLKCPNVVLLGAAAGRWNAPKCVPEGMATGSKLLAQVPWMGQGRVKPVPQWWSDGG